MYRISYSINYISHEFSIVLYEYTIYGHIFSAYSSVTENNTFIAICDIGSNVKQQDIKSNAPIYFPRNSWIR